MGLASPRPERCDQDLSCVDTMRAGYPGPGAQNRFPAGDGHYAVGTSAVRDVLTGAEV
jgi:hypothetical protein